MGKYIWLCLPVLLAVLLLKHVAFRNPSVDFNMLLASGLQSFSSKLREHGFVHSYVDYSLFTYGKGDTFITPFVYVDNIVLVKLGLLKACIHVYVPIDVILYGEAKIHDTLIHGYCLLPSFRCSLFFTMSIEFIV